MFCLLVGERHALLVRKVGLCFLIFKKRGNFITDERNTERNYTLRRLRWLYGVEWTGVEWRYMLFISSLFSLAVGCLVFFCSHFRFLFVLCFSCEGKGEILELKWDIYTYRYVYIEDGFARGLLICSYSYIQTYPDLPI